MAGEIQLAHSESAVTLYAHLYNASGQIWNTAGTPAFEAYATANIADYDIAMTEQGTASRWYLGNMPAVPAGWYSLTVQKRVGGAPAETDPYVGEQDAAYWTGSAWLVPASIADYTTARAAKLDNLDAAISTVATPAQVNAQVLDVLNVDTFAEMGSGAPTATPTLKEMLMYLYMALRNASQATATERRIANNAGTVIAKATMSDNGTTFNQGKLGAP